MGHRHIYNTSPIFEGDHDQNWNHIHTDQHIMHLGPASSSENGFSFYPVENMSVDGIPFTSHWSSAPRSNVYASASLNAEVTPRQRDVSSSSHDHFLHSTTGGSLRAVPENYAHHASSSNDRQTFHVVEGGFVDLTMSSGRGPHKRKSPGIPSICERGSSSRYHNAGTSNDLLIPSEPRPEKPSIESQYMPWDHPSMNPTFRGNGISFRGDSSLRNVRSRSAPDLEPNLAGTHLSNSHLHNSYSITHPINHPGTVDLSGQSSGSSMQDWSHMSMSPPGRLLISDTGGSNHETAQFLVGSSNDNMGYHTEFVTNRNLAVSQNFLSINSVQPIRGARSNYSQRYNPSFRSSTLCLGQMATSDDGPNIVPESYNFRHSRPVPVVGMHNSDRNGRSRLSSDRYRSLADDNSLHDRISTDGFMVVDRTSLYGARSMFDQHRDMRMDIDNMSYEELLALGERIGHVSTGLSEDLISKCLKETVCCSSGRNQGEGTCVICLEEYKGMDDIGALETCGHDYHVACIRKWLSLKNLCPICKASALPDNTKEK